MSLLAVFLIGWSISPLTSSSGGGGTAATRATAATPAGTAAIAAVPIESRDRTAYEAAWIRAQRVTSHLDASRVAEVLATALRLNPGPLTTQIEQYVDRLLAGCPGCYPTATKDPTTTLYRLLREDGDGFNRLLVPLVADSTYVRYVKLRETARGK